MLTLPESSWDWRLLPAVEKGKNYQIIVGTSDTLCLLLFAFQATFPLLSLRSNFDWVIQASPTPHSAHIISSVFVLQVRVSPTCLDPRPLFSPFTGRQSFTYQLSSSQCAGFHQKVLQPPFIGSRPYFQLGVVHKFRNRGWGLAFPNDHSISSYILKSINLKGHLLKKCPHQILLHLHVVAMRW